jgi:hypothetical protein
VTVVTNARAFYTTRAAAGALSARHSPRPLIGAGGTSMANLARNTRRDRGLISWRHCEPPGRANARPMTGSAKQSILTSLLLDGLLRFARNDGLGCLEIESRSTSPRLRGEVGDGAQRSLRVRGTLRESESVESPPHPLAPGQRERAARSSRPKSELRSSRPRKRGEVKTSETVAGRQ